MITVRVKNHCPERVKVSVDIDKDGNTTITIEAI